MPKTFASGRDAPSGSARAGLVRAQDRRRLEPILRRLNAIGAVNPSETASVERLLGHVEQHRPGVELLTGAARGAPRAVLSGWGCRYRLLPDGRRQIFDFVLPGDIMGFCVEPGPLDATDAVALTAMETAGAASLRTAALDAAAYPVFAAALAAGPVTEQARLLDHVLRLGRLSAAERFGNLLLELRRRLAAAGLADDGRFPLPVTQECLADALGLSVVHVNRVLQQLRRDRLIEMRSGQVTVLDPDGLAALGQLDRPALALALAKAGG